MICYEYQTIAKKAGGYGKVVLKELSTAREDIDAS